MKNLCFTTLLICFISFATAQDSTNVDNKNFQFGLRHGYSLSDISDGYNVLSETNLYVGAFFETKLSKRLSLQLETNYSRSALLEIPLLLKYKITDKFQLYAGPQLDLSLGNNNRNGFEDEDFGASLVFGLQYNMSKHWFVEARYTYGISDQFIFNEFSTVPSFGNKQSFGVGLGYKF
jgi:opacity protein-like surface antigen